METSFSVSVKHVIILHGEWDGIPSGWPSLVFRYYVCLKESPQCSVVVVYVAWTELLVLREGDAGAHGAAAVGGWQLSHTVMEPGYVHQGLRPL